MSVLNSSNKIELVDKGILRPNSISFEFYGEFTLTKPDDHTLLLSIANEGIKEALYVTKNHLVISGNRRLHVAKLLSTIDKVPVVYLDIDDNEVDEYLIVTHQQNRTKDLVDITKEYLVILKRFDSRKGKKNPLLDKAREEFLSKNNKNFSKRSMDRMISCHKMLVENEGMKSNDAWTNLKEQVQSKTKVSFIEKNLKERQINRDNKDKAKGQKTYNDDYFKLIHDDSRKIGNHITGEVIDNVTTSPPYFSMKLYLEDDVNVKGSGRRNLKTKQIGQENTIPKYIDSLMDVLKEVNKVLKETGSVFINVMDSSIDGITQRIPDKLINAYEESGVTFVQYIYWYKKNVLPRYMDDKKFQTSLEYILHFVKDPKKYKWIKKWEDKEDEFLGDIVIGGKGKNKVFRNILIYPDPKDELNGEEVKKTSGLIQSNVINNHSLNKLLKEKGYQLQHNALYSVEIPMICIMSTTQSGDTVLDPWSGMATTGIVAFANGCKYYGFDQSEVYTAQASVRIEDFLGNNKELVKKIRN